VKLRAFLDTQKTRLVFERQTILIRALKGSQFQSAPWKCISCTSFLFVAVGSHVGEGEGETGIVFTSGSGTGIVLEIEFKSAPIGGCERRERSLLWISRSHDTGHAYLRLSLFFRPL